jgi:hypothetical protein
MSVGIIPESGFILSSLTQRFSGGTSGDCVSREEEDHPHLL